MKRVLLFLLFLYLALLVFGCSGPEEKKARFFTRGQALYEQGEYVNAALELKNALQIDPKYTEAYHLLGQVEAAQKNFKVAVGHFLKAVELDPTYNPAHLQLGKIYLGARLPEKALGEVATVLAANPNDQEARLLKAAVWVAQEKYEQAQSCLESLLAEGVTEADGYLLLGAMYLQQGSIVRAQTTIEEGLVANPDHTVLQMKLADLYQRQGQFDRAAQLLQKMVEARPDKTDLILMLAMLHRKAGEKERAEAVLNQFLSDHGTDAGSWVKVAKFHLAGRQLDRAIQVLQQGIEQQPQLGSLRLALAELILNSTRDTEKALGILEEGHEAIKDDESPEAIKLQTALARLHYQRGDLKAVERYLTQVLQASPKNNDALFLRGSLDLLQGNGGQAVSAFRTVVNERPEFIDGRIQLAEAHIMNRELSLAADTLQQGLAAFPGSRPLRLAYARLQARQGRYGEARATLDAWLKAHPQDLQVLAETGEYHVAEGQLSEAKKVYTQLIDRAPKLPQGYLRLAGCFQREGRLSQASSEIEKGVKVLPDDNLLAEALVQLCLQQGQQSKASKFIRQRLDRRGDNAFDRNLHGEMLLAAKRLPEARKSFEQAITQHPEWPAPYKNLAETYLREGDLMQAETVFQKAIEKTPRNVAAYQALGYLKQRKGDSQAAIALLEKALELKPDFWRGANDLAFLLAEATGDNADLDRALNLARQAHNLAPEDPSVLDTLGWVEYRRGNLREAQQWLRQSLAGGAVSPEVDYHMGMVSFDLGQKEQARQFLEKALSGTAEFSGKDKARKVLENI